MMEKPNTMKVISDSMGILDAIVAIGEVDGVDGLILESRGGTKGTPHERNSDYLEALETIILRLQRLGQPHINIFVVSTQSMKTWNMNERALTVDGLVNISLVSESASQIRRKICKAQQEKKENLNSKGGNPTKRILISCSLEKEAWETVVQNNFMTIDDNDIDLVNQEFDPSAFEPSKEHIVKAIAVRRGQQTFRNALLNAYNGRCAVTRTQLTSVLEAAHISPYSGKWTNHITNGILLRADVHTLFDLGLIGIDPEYYIHVSNCLKITEYFQYHGKKLHLPNDPQHWPSQSSLKTRLLPDK